MWGKRFISATTFMRAMNNAFQAGQETEREEIIERLLNDAVIQMTMPTVFLDHVVKVIEKDWTNRE